MSLEEALERRLATINCTPEDIQRFLAHNPPEGRLTPVGGRVCMCVCGRACVRGRAGTVRRCLGGRVFVAHKRAKGVPSRPLPRTPRRPHPPLPSRPAHPAGRL